MICGKKKCLGLLCHARLGAGKTPRRNPPLEELVQLPVRTSLGLWEQEHDGNEVCKGDASEEQANLLAPTGALVGQE